MAETKLAPLSTQVPIVDEHGNPTPYFQQLMQIFIDEKNATADDVTDIGTEIDNLTLDDLVDVDTATTPPEDAQALVYDEASGLWLPGDVAAGGGGGGALQLIDSVLVTGAAIADINFSNIPSTYQDLVLIVNGRSTVAATGTVCLIQMNGDTGNNYDWEQDNRFGATNAQSVSSARCVQLSGSTSPAGATGMACVQILDYSLPHFHKSFFSDGAFKQTAAASNFFRNNFQGAWKSTSTINALRLFPASGSWEVGSRVTLYGRGGTPPSGSSEQWAAYTSSDGINLDVPLDADDGRVYEVLLTGINGAAGSNTYAFRISDDNAVTFYSGASDYKNAGGGAMSSIAVTNSVGTGRSFAVRFTLAGMNNPSTERFHYVGVYNGIDSGGSGGANTIAGSPNALGLKDYNGFRFFGSAAGCMNGVTCYVKRVV